MGVINGILMGSYAVEYLGHYLIKLLSVALHWIHW